ncbi:hypothetical protein D1AOALGA4SA_13196, partial [Olavius algarvensis Delta 1 endosymbiont]
GQKNGQSDRKKNCPLCQIYAVSDELIGRFVLVLVLVLVFVLVLEAFEPLSNPSTRTSTRTSTI